VVKGNNRNIGKLEYWNDGFWKKMKNLFNFAIFHYSTIPSSQNYFIMS